MLIGLSEILYDCLGHNVAVSKMTFHVSGITIAVC